MVNEVLTPEGLVPLVPRRAPTVRLRIAEPGEPERSREPFLRVGLLGGSFNPAHEGHRFVSVEALRRLGLDQVWWLVSPQNPLKPIAGMAPLDARIRSALAVARHPRIRVSALETRLGTRFTADTLDRLNRWPGYRFVWLIGADNLVQLPRWKRWADLVATTPVAVVARQPYLHTALAGKVAHRFGDARIGQDAARQLVTTSTPAWTFVRLRPHSASATALRRGEATVGTPNTESAPSQPRRLGRWISGTSFPSS